MFEIVTERLILRDFIPEDVSSYVRLTQDEKYQRFYDEEDCSVEKAEFLVNLFVEQASEIPRSKYQLAIVLKDTSQVIGTCGIRIETDHQASMGCGVAREFQGAGYAQEAVEAIAAFGFETLNVHRLYAETIGANKAAIAMCRQFGMRKEAQFVEHRFFKERWWDTVIYAILKSEWNVKKDS
ncbi:putative Acyl-CoA N-acyltransferase [Vibrio nigripulchritudo SO65]|uniref:GNAT family N-acetyltransferase n=1 Tax=Vibrio nigripulchritudo TaxID=28173 RepID=UPI0003B1A09A|nr:GNAT family protein [Vibrio nigripulchritudo]CCN36675.1 putative Acyl-CoA N-acyltransferase [Vibrio nigripulchritudo AM115]CCN44031.1 putative Acyl-CoA N-acyltransferase [Vibrio nigripulchritudo FTn2]CCN66933.1 putative Acyl-CoA N-acyltransferase [Vibrio nigripulchritudo POn4]CCN76695.1 putative Acyl-CoA N-acyltransferase [Vibrio nigripulchritudo SO65]BDU37819.1 acetyltransferase [Vibrio nigripulchritudo]